ncbi:MAG TPA: hypothetical protein VND99_04390 [Candidatus Acidoferrales bacterium]|nr:hypothetical protein [Candidatus Acidoferrales bacterium]
MKQKKQNKQKDILFILISSFIVIVAWIAFNIYHIYITSTISEAIQLQLAPITATFDPATIQQLKTRENIVPVYDLQTGASQSAVIPTPTIAANNPSIASDSSQLAPTNSPIYRQGQ